MKPPFGAQLQTGHPLAQGLEGVWLFNEKPNAVGTVYDLGGNSWHGSLKSGVHSVAGPFGPTLLFDRTSSDYIDLPTTDQGHGWGTSAGRPYLSVVSWIRTSDNSNSITICSKDDTGGGLDGSWQFRRTGTDKLALFAFSGHTTEFAASAIGAVSDGVWHQVVGTWDGLTPRIYIDAEQDTTQLGGGTAGPIDDSPGIRILIGAVESGGIGTPSEFFDGNIDHVLLYDRVLSLEEIGSLFVRPFQMFDEEPLDLIVAATSQPGPGPGPSGDEAMMFGSDF